MQQIKSEQHQKIKTFEEEQRRERYRREEEERQEEQRCYTRKRRHRSLEGERRCGKMEPEKRGGIEWTIIIILLRIHRRVGMH